MTAVFEHPALFYADVDEFLTGTVPFVQAGLSLGEPVLVAVPDRNLAHLRAALGADADEVRTHDMTVAGRNPGRIIPGVLLAFAAAHPGQRVRMIGEPIWAGRTDVEYPACAQHEALINTAFADRDATILCPYDTARLHPTWIDDAYRTHPVVQSAGRRATSAGYADPTAVAGSFNRPLPDPPRDAATIRVDYRALSAVRRFVRDRAAAAGLDEDRADDLTIAVNELASNTVEHTSGPGSVAVWTADDRLACQVTDTGHLTDPMAGRIPVPPDQATGGRGLVLVNHLCDLVRVHTRPGRTTVRVEMAL